MEIKDQVPVRLTGGILKTIHDVRDATWVRLLSQIANTHSIARGFEGHHVVRVQGNGPCVFPRRKQILRQVDARHVVVMRTSGEQIQHVLFLPAITHQIVQQIVGVLRSSTQSVGRVGQKHGKRTATTVG